MMLGRMLHTDDVVSHRIVADRMTACGRRAWHVFDGDPALEVRCKRCFPKVAR